MLLLLFVVAAVRCYCVWTAFWLANESPNELFNVIRFRPNRRKLPNMVRPTIYRMQCVPQILNSFAQITQCHLLWNTSATGNKVRMLTTNIVRYRSRIAPKFVLFCHLAYWTSIYLQYRWNCCAHRKNIMNNLRINMFRSLFIQIAHTIWNERMKYID